MENDPIGVCPVILVEGFAYQGYSVLLLYVFVLFGNETEPMNAFLDKLDGALIFIR